MSAECPAAAGGQTAGNRTEPTAAAGGLAISHPPSVELDALYQSAPIGLCVLDAELRYVRINENLARMNGLPVADHLGRTMREVVPRLADRAESAFRRILATGRAETDFEISSHTAAQPGVLRTWRINALPLKAADGTPTAINIVVQEITDRKRAEDTLREEVSKSALYLQVAEVILMALDTAGRITLLNRKGCRLLGYAEGEIIGKDWFETCICAEDRAGLRSALESIIAGDVGSFEYHENRVVTKDGRHLRIEWHNAFIRDERGRIVGTLHSGEDVTARREAEEERDRILDMSRDLICVAGMDGYFKYVNPAWQRTLGYGREELLSRPFLDFIHPDDHGRNDSEVAKLAAGQPSSAFENRYVHKDGTTRTFRWTAAPMPEHGLMYCVGRDVTESKRAEDDIRRLNAELEQRIEERTSALRRLAARISTIQDQEQQHAAETLHDGIAQLLVACSLKLADLRGSAPRGKALATIDQIERLIQETHKTVQSLTFELWPVTLSRVGLGNAIEELCGTMTERHGVRFRFESDGDAAPLPRETAAVLFKAARELMFNVVKHAGVAEASVSFAAGEGGLRIAVVDAGVGFPGRPRPGAWSSTSGFGLLFVGERMHSIGGRMTIESDPGVRTRVSLLLPATPGAGDG